MVRTVKHRGTAGEKLQDADTRQLYDAIRAAFPGQPDEIERVVYARPSGGIRARIVAPIFSGVPEWQREDRIAGLLAGLSAEALGRLRLLILLAPEEAGDARDSMNLEFDDPSGERL